MKTTLASIIFCTTIHFAVGQVAGDLRQISSVGYLEVYDGNQWVWVCDDLYQNQQGQDINVLNFICRQLSGDINATAVAATSNNSYEPLPDVSISCNIPIGGNYLGVPSPLPATIICPMTVGNILTDCSNVTFTGQAGCATDERVCIECLVNNNRVSEFPFVVAPVVPTLTEWGIIILGLALGIIGIINIRARQTQTTYLNQKVKFE